MEDNASLILPSSLPVRIMNTAMHQPIQTPGFKGITYFLNVLLGFPLNIQVWSETVALRYSCVKL